MLLRIASVISATNQPSDFSATVRPVRGFLMCFIYGLHLSAMTNLFFFPGDYLRCMILNVFNQEKHIFCLLPCFSDHLLVPPLPPTLILFVFHLQQIVMYKVCSVYISVLTGQMLQWLAWGCNSEKWIVYNLLCCKDFSLLTVLMNLKCLHILNCNQFMRVLLLELQGSSSGERQAMV